VKPPGRRRANRLIVRGGHRASRLQHRCAQVTPGEDTSRHRRRSASSINSYFRQEISSVEISGTLAQSKFI